MPEYFDISLISQKTDTSKENVQRCLVENFGLSEGENNVEYFCNREVLVSYIEDEKRDFEEFSLGFPEQVFHKGKFEDELRVFTSFITTCFECCTEIQYAVCSYELNGYLLGNIKNIEEFNNELLNNFPIIYKRDKERTTPSLVINLKAQDILV